MLYYIYNKKTFTLALTFGITFCATQICFYAKEKQRLIVLRLCIEETRQIQYGSVTQ